MKIVQIDLSRDYSDVVKEAIRILKLGGVIVYPTDTLYALGANALEETPVRKIFAIKRRSFAKPLPIVIKNILWANELAYIRPKIQPVLEKIWPGQVTAILPKKEIVPAVLTATNKTIGMRIADHPLVDQLLGRFGYPLTSTSANISGDEPTRDINVITQLFASIGPRPDLIIDAGTLPPSPPSTIVDLTGDRPKILRVGATKPEFLLQLLDGI